MSAPTRTLRRRTGSSEEPASRRRAPHTRRRRPIALHIRCSSEQIAGTQLARGSLPSSGSSTPPPRWGASSRAAGSRESANDRSPSCGNTRSSARRSTNTVGPPPPRLGGSHLAVQPRNFLVLPEAHPPREVARVVGVARMPVKPSVSTSAGAAVRIRARDQRSPLLHGDSVARPAAGRLASAGEHLVEASDVLRGRDEEPALSRSPRDRRARAMGWPR